jgi:hypothetical protein
MTEVTALTKAFGRRPGRWLIAAVILALFAGPAMPQAAAAQDTIAPGTEITAQNWQKYKDFMPDGMQLLFAGTANWKVPPDIKIEIGPTSNYPLPQIYQDNTRKYASQVKIVTLPDGTHGLSGYVAGQPFPNPSDPMKGYKILANVWYRYVPYLLCGADSHVYMFSGGQISPMRAAMVFRRLSHISDVGQPINDPHAQGIDYSQYIMIMEPEQYKYTQILTLFYDDPARSEEDFVFVPQLRRVIRQSPNSRCAPVSNSDFTPDDLLGFNGGISRFNADYVRDQSIITLINSKPADYGVLTNYFDMRFPKPVLGKWEVRDTYVIDVRRIPSQSAGYCYGRQRLWTDKASGVVFWKDLYDGSEKIFKTEASLKPAGPVIDEGVQLDSGNEIAAMWDLSKDHMSQFISSGPGGNGLYNQSNCRNVDGVNYDDIDMYSTSGGLTQVMR